MALKVRDTQLASFPNKMLEAKLKTSYLILEKIGRFRKRLNLTDVLGLSALLTFSSVSRLTTCRSAVAELVEFLQRNAGAQ